MKVKYSETVLIVDDSPDTRELIKRNLASRGFKIFTAPDVPAALKVLESTQIDLVITDLKMPKVSGLDLVKHVRENLKKTEVMMITGYPSVEGAVEAVKAGAEEYLAKPFTDEELFTAVDHAISKLHIRQKSLDPVDNNISSDFGILGESEVMVKLRRTITKTADMPATVLITGESGTGKELVARAIHYSGKRASQPFLPVNCGGIPESLLESELFGHVKGAFTGASESRAGFFQTADKGTIFLDEISETSIGMQVKLLRVLQEKEIVMVGASKPVAVDVRIIAATNKTLESLIKKDQFREDLYFRLNVISITIPPLRDRSNDIILLARYFGDKYAEEFGKPSPKFSDRALDTLMHYHWPGNVRELENVIQRLIIMLETEKVDVADLPSLMHFSSSSSVGFDRTLAEVEAEYINNVLSSVTWNKSKASEILGIDRKTLREKIRKYDLKESE